MREVSSGMGRFSRGTGLVDSVGGLVVREGGDAGQKIPMGGVGQKGGTAGDGVHC